MKNFYIKKFILNNIFLIFIFFLLIVCTSYIKAAEAKDPNYMDGTLYFTGNYVTKTDSGFKDFYGAKREEMTIFDMYINDERYGELRVFCLHPSLSAANGWKYTRVQNSHTGGTTEDSNNYTDEIATYLSKGNIINNNPSIRNNSGETEDEKLSIMAYYVISQVVQYENNNDRNLYFQKQLVIWRLCNLFKYIDTGIINRSNQDLLNNYDSLRMQIDATTFIGDCSKIEKLVDQVNRAWRQGSNLYRNNFKNIISGMKLYYTNIDNNGNYYYGWNNQTQMLIGYKVPPSTPSTPSTPDPDPDPNPNPVYYNVKISRIYQDSDGNNLYASPYIDKNGSVKEGTTVNYTVPDYDLVDRVNGIGKSEQISFTVNGNKEITIYYKVGRIKIKYYVTDELNKTIMSKEEFLKDFNGSTFYLYGNNGVNVKLASEHDGYEYKGLNYSGNTRNWKTTSIQIGRSQNDVTVNAYYGLRHVYIGYFYKNGNSISPIKVIDRRTYPSINYSFSDDIKITSSANSTIYAKSNNDYNKYVYTNGIYGGASNTPQALYKTNIRNEIRWKWYSGVSQSLDYSKVYNTNYIDTNNNTNTSFSGSGITIKGLTTEYNKIPGNTSYSIHFYYKIEKPMKVYVRHYVKNSSGTYDLDNTIANTEEVWYNKYLSYNHGNDILGKEQWYKVNNGFNQRKFGTTNNWNDCTDTVASTYSEMYTLDKGDWLMVDRSRTIIKDGYIYNCTECKKKTVIGTQVENDWKNQSNTKLSIRSSADGKKSEDTYSVYVNYYYDKENYSNDDPGGDGGYTVDGKITTNISNTIIGRNAKLKFVSKRSDNYQTIYANENVAYVPVLENLKPYIETSICMPRNLIYKIDKVETEAVNDNGTVKKSAKITYGIKEYTALGISSDYSAIVLGITGGEEKKVYSNSGNFTAIKSDENTWKTRISNTKNTLLGVNASNIFNGTIKNNKKTILDALKKVTDDTKTKENYFKDDHMYDINVSKYNGMREPTGVAYYREYDIINNSVKDKYYSSTINNENSMDVNIYTPMEVSSATIKTDNFVNHSNNSNATILQKGAEFTLTPKINSGYKDGCYNSNLPDIKKYLKGYYVIFGFEVKTSYGATLEAGRPIWVPRGGSITATPTAYEGDEAVKQLHETIQIIAVTINASDDLLMNAYGTTNGVGIKDYASQVPIKLGLGQLPFQTSTVTSKDQNKYEEFGISMDYDSHYFVKKDTVTTTIARLYDFKITDCYDIDFKNVFRRSGSNDVNSSTGIQYFSGIKSLNVYTSYYNTINDRTGINISNSKSKTILPLGPYKNTNTSYVKAPKLGYRFSFDVKTFGYYNYDDDKNNSVERKVKITPEYYYISKDGTEFKDKDQIKLYYKNSQGKYVTFEQSSYNISFKPNDGYRFIQNLTATDKTNHMSTQLLDLNVGKFFELDHRMMSTSSDNFIQAWYGEYKVPNSTIIVEKDSNGKIDLNKPLTNGYLGVIFKIECIDKNPNSNETVTVMYDQNDQNDGRSNTSQWDYEGYLGFNSPGSNASGLSLQLEKGTWNINNEMYNNIKGTIVLYDIDNKAANDFD